MPLTPACEVYLGNMGTYLAHQKFIRSIFSFVLVGDDSDTFHKQSPDKKVELRIRPEVPGASGQF